MRDGTVATPNAQGWLDGLAGGLLGCAGTPACMPVASLMALVAAWMCRAKAVPLALLAPHLDIVFCLAAGSLAGMAWAGAGAAPAPRWRRCLRLTVLTGLGLALLAAAWLGMPSGAALAGSPQARAAAGILAGIGIGALSKCLSIDGTLLVIPALAVLYGLDIKVAGSLALMAAFPLAALAVLRQRGAGWPRDQRWYVAVGTAVVAGAAPGALLAGLLPSAVLIALLGIATLRAATLTLR